MRDQEIIGLWEAYQQVYAQPQEEVEQLDEITASMGRRAREYRNKKAQDAHMAAVEKHQERMRTDPDYAKKHEESRTVHSRRANGEGGEDQKESVDLFDYLLEYLVAEGYADTNKAALAIMANMSEEWKQSIVEDVYMGSPKKPGMEKKPTSQYNPGGGRQQHNQSRSSAPAPLPFGVNPGGPPPGGTPISDFGSPTPAAAPRPAPKPQPRGR